MSEINKSRLESVLMLKKISYKEIDKVINGDEENSFKFESLLKGNKPIPKNVERKLFDYLLTDKNLDIKAYVYNETDDINFDIKPKANKPARRVNIYGATTKDEKMSDEYIANHLNPSIVKDRYRELGFTISTLSLFINENYNKSFAEIMNPNRRKYITHDDENNIGYLLETNYTTLVTGGKKHKAVAEYKIPEYAKFCINLDRLSLLSENEDQSEKMIKRLNISTKLFHTIITKKFPVGFKFIELFTKTYNDVFDTNYKEEEFMLGISEPSDIFYDEKKEDVAETSKNNLNSIDLSKLPEAWKVNNNIIEEPKQEEEVTTIDKKNIKYSCKCGNLVSDRWIANQKCSLCGTVMRRLGGFDNIEFNTSVVDNTSKNEEPKSVDDMINEVLEGLANSSCKEDVANAEIENIIDTYNDYKDTISIDKIYSVLKRIIKTEKALKYLDDYNEKQKKLLIESQLREPRAVDLSEVLKPTEAKKEEVISPEYIINYIDEHFDSLIMDKMIDVLKSKSKAKYNLEVADKFMDELNKDYNYANSNS